MLEGCTFHIVSLITRSDLFRFISVFVFPRLSLNSAEEYNVPLDSCSPPIAFQESFVSSLLLFALPVIPIIVECPFFSCRVTPRSSLRFSSLFAMKYKSLYSFPLKNILFPVILVSTRFFVSSILPVIITGSDRTKSVSRRCLAISESLSMNSNLNAFLSLLDVLKRTGIDVPSLLMKLLAMSE